MPIPGQELLDYIKKEWGILVKAPFSFIGLAVVCLACGYGVGEWYYSGQVGLLREQIKERNDQIGRYQVVLGIKPGSPGALVELNNQELALKAQSLAAKIRQVSAVLEAKYAEIDNQLASKKMTQEQAGKARVDAARQVSQDFDNNLASDAYNVENELRSRLSPEALSHVIMVPGFVLKGPDGTVAPHSRITFPQLMRGPFEAMALSRLADEIDQMAKLLPPDSKTRSTWSLQ